MRRWVSGLLVLAVAMGMLPALPGPPAAAQAPPPSTTEPEQTPAPDQPAPGEELVEARTRESKTFATEEPDEFTTRVFAEPVHFRNGSGGWSEIRRSLRRTSSGRFTNDLLNEFGISIASDIGDRQLVRFETKDGLGIGFSLEGARPSGASLEQRGDSPSVLFRDVRPDVDLRLTLTSEGLKEDVILRSPSAQDTFVFSLTLDGLAARVDPDRSVAYVDAEGQVRFRTPAGFMFDSSGGSQGQPPAFSNDGVTYRIVQRSDGPALEMRLDRAWLDDPARRFPVTADPPVTTRSDDPDDYSTYFYEDTLYWSGNTTSDYRNFNPLAVGRAGDNRYRSYLQFGSGKLTRGDGPHTINSAILKVYNGAYTRCDRHVLASIHR